MKRTGTPAARNVDMFVSMLMFNYLIAAPDAHAKNYSLLLDREALIWYLPMTLPL